MYKEDLLELLSLVDDDADIGILTNGFARPIVGIKVFKEGQKTRGGEIPADNFDAALVPLDGWDYGKIKSI